MSGSSFDYMSFLPLIMIFVIFYFLLLRPQQKKMKAQQEMLNNIKRGDKIVTNGGLIGTISRIINDQELQVEIAPGVQVRVMRPMVNTVIIGRTEMKAINDSSFTEDDNNFDEASKMTPASKGKVTSKKPTSGQKTKK